MADTPLGTKRQLHRTAARRRLCVTAVPVTLLLVILATLQARPRGRPARMRHVTENTPVRRIGELPDLPGGASVLAGDTVPSISAGARSTGGEAAVAGVRARHQQSQATQGAGGSEQRGDHLSMQQQQQAQQEQLSRGVAGGKPSVVAAGSAGVWSDASGAAQGSVSSSRPTVFLFTGILSGRGFRHRRLAVREAWADRAQVAGLSAARFVLSEDEKSPQVLKEMEEHDDVIFAPQKTTYQSILYKTYFVLQHAVTAYDAAFVLKTDDDAFVNVPALLIALKRLCMSEGCKQERLYMGRMAVQSEVLMAAGHKWNNLLFHNHTGLRVYPKYAMGGGYVLSGDVASMLVDMQERIRLKFTTIEDATLGFWLMALDLRHVDHPRFLTYGIPCCFQAAARREGQSLGSRFQLTEEIEAHACGPNPWLVLHKIESPTKMRYVGQQFAQCPPDSQPASTQGAGVQHRRVFQKL